MRRGTFGDVAGFRSGRGRDSGSAQGRQYPQQQYPYGQQQHPYGQQQPPYGQQPAPGAWPQAGQGQYPGPPQPPAGPGQPEYFGPPQGGDPYANNPGHTQSFSVQDPYGQGGYHDGAPEPPPGPRLSWKELLSGIVLRPHRTFWQMRDYPVWGPALLVTFLYGLLAVFGFDKAREDAINTTISSAIPYVLTTGIAMVIAGLLLGVVTHTLARQLGGVGSWAPTVGLSMLIMSLTDAPRLVFALFLGGEASLVQLIGWLTWIASGFLFTSMVSRSHDLPWLKALGASAIQLLALLFLIKLGTF